MKKYIVSITLKGEILHSGFKFSKRKRAEKFIRSFYFMDNYMSYTLTRIENKIEEDLTCRNLLKKE